MDLQRLEQLIDETNAELLSGAPGKIHDMTLPEIEAFMGKMEVMYKNCLKIKHSQHQKVFKVGLNFEEYAKAQQKKDQKQKEKNEKAQQTKAEKKSKGGNILKGMGIGVEDMMATIASFCMEHKKKKVECGCA